MRSTRGQAPTSAGIVFTQVGDDLINILRPDGSPELIDHLVDALFPARAVHDRSIHGNVVQAMADGAGGGGKIVTLSLDQADAFFARDHAAAGEEGTHPKSGPQRRTPHATSRASDRILLS